MIGKCMVALVTPFTSGNIVDVRALKELVIRLLQDGVDGFIVCGTTAEVCTLSMQERIVIVDTIIETVAGRAAIWVGCGTNCTKKSYEYMQSVEDKDIDGILLVVPYYNRPSQEGMYQHFYYLAHHTKHPIMLYNVPKRTGAILENETIERLIENCPNIVALKQAFSDLSICHSNVVKEHDFKVLSGDDGSLLECLQNGGYGIVSVLGHIVNHKIKKIIDAYDKDICLYEEDEELKKMSDVVFKESNPCGIKYILAKKGWMNAFVRLPLVEVSDSTKVAIDMYFD